MEYGRVTGLRHVGDVRVEDEAIPAFVSGRTLGPPPTDPQLFRVELTCEGYRLLLWGGFDDERVPRMDEEIAYEWHGEESVTVYWPYNRARLPNEVDVYGYKYEIGRWAWKLPAFVPGPAPIL